MHVEMVNPDIIEEPKIKGKFYNSSLLIFLYFLQGLVIGILLETMQMKLKANFSYKEIGIFLLCSYPFSLKIFWSFIVDTYYIKSIGLRKTWIILTQTISSLILFYLSYHIDDFIIEKKIYNFSLICFILMFCVATQDIAVDGWALSLCGKNNGSLASSCQAIGQMLGICVSTSVYINLHHYDLVQLNSFFLYVSIAYLIGTFILFFIDEQPEEHQEEVVSLIKTFKRISIMTQNKNLRKLIFTLLLTNVGNIFFNSIITLVLLEKGVSQELLTNVSTVLIPVEVYISFHLSNTKSNFLKNFLFGYKNLIYVYILSFCFVMFYDYVKIWDEYYNIFTVIIVFSLSTIKTILCLNCHNGLGGFFHRISDNKIGATYITALNSFSNLAHKWPGILIFTLVDYFGFKIVGFLSILYCVGFYLIFKDTFLELDETKEKDWTINDAVLEKES